jgi:hypothetical protein
LIDSYLFRLEKLTSITNIFFGDYQRILTTNIHEINYLMALIRIGLLDYYLLKSIKK